MAPSRTGSSRRVATRTQPFRAAKARALRNAHPKPSLTRASTQKKKRSTRAKSRGRPARRVPSTSNAVKSTETTPGTLYPSSLGRHRTYKLLAASAVLAKALESTPCAHAGDSTPSGFPARNPTSPSPAPTEIDDYSGPPPQRSILEIARELAEASVRVRDFAYAGSRS